MSHNKLRCLLILYLQFLIVHFSYADTIVPYKGRNVISLSDYYLFQQMDHNLSAAAFVSHSMIACVIQNSFLMKELTSATVEGALLYRQSLFSLRVSHVGYSMFGEMCVSSGYARLFGRRVAFAMQFHYLWQHASGYDCVHSLTFDVSLYAKLTRKIYCGFSVYNPARLKYGLLSEVPLPVRFDLDFNYELGKNIMLDASIQKELKSSWNVRLGAYYKIKCLLIQTHVQFPNISCEVVAAITWHRCLVGATLQYKQPLGLVTEIKFQMML